MLLNKVHDILNTMKSHEYSNHSFVDEKNGIYRFNCASFILYLLSLVGLQLDSKRACDLYVELDNYGMRIFELNDIEPGDIVIWKKNVIPKRGDSGHVAIVNDIQENRLQVIDCVKELHDQDTRVSPGIGMGWIELLCKENEIAGFRWLGNSIKTKYTDIKIIRLNL